jgi:hypothetical protein
VIKAGSYRLAHNERLQVQQFFYDDQIRRFLLQFTRIFSGFQVEYANENDGVNAAALLRVPVRYGDASRNAQTIIQENSRNSLPSTPLMTFYITGLDYEQSRMQEPTFVSKVNVRQRTYDPSTETYETTQGNAFTVERLMPVPFKLTIQLDIWTSNTNQKLQLLEQILTLFNPSLEIQSTDNYIDWTSLSVMYLDRTTWTSRTIPIGTDNPIDVASLTFSMPIFLSSPAKVKKLGVVERIVASMYDAQGDLADAVTNSDLLLGTRQVITPFNYATVLIDNGGVMTLQVLQQKYLAEEPSNDELTPTEIVPDSNLLWPAVVGMYGALRPGVSQIRLEQPDGTEVVGTVVLDPNDDRFMLYNVDIDTAPQNTLDPIDAIINPLASGPRPQDSVLEGVRYLLTEDTGSADNPAPASDWVGANGRGLIAQANDIVEYSNNYWRVVFRAATETNNTQYVTNITTGIQYRWTGEAWVKSYQGVYPGGTWRLVL